MANEPNFISRHAAEAKVREHWQPAVDACRSVHAPEPVVCYTRARNYEIEAELHLIFGGTWVINEWCPFKGWSLSRWRDYCPREALDAVLEAHQRMVDAGEMHPAVLDPIKEKITERFGG